MVSKPLNSFINEPNRTLYARNRQYKCKKERKIANKFNDYRIEKIAQLQIVCIKHSNDMYDLSDAVIVKRMLKN